MRLVINLVVALIVPNFTLAYELPASNRNLANCTEGNVQMVIDYLGAGSSNTLRAQIKIYENTELVAESIGEYTLQTVGDFIDLEFKSYRRKNDEIQGPRFIEAFVQYGGRANLGDIKEDSGSLIVRMPSQVIKFENMTCLEKW